MILYNLIVHTLDTTEPIYLPELIGPFACERQSCIRLGVLCRALLLTTLWQVTCQTRPFIFSYQQSSKTRSWESEQPYLLHSLSWDSLVWLTPNIFALVRLVSSFAIPSIGFSPFGFRQDQHSRTNSSFIERQVYWESIVSWNSLHKIRGNPKAGSSLSTTLEMVDTTVTIPVSFLYRRSPICVMKNVLNPLT